MDKGTQYRRILIDFVTDDKCAFCNSGKLLKIGILLEDLSTGERVYASTSCYKDKLQGKIMNEKDPVLDLTRGILSNSSNISTKGKSSPQNNIIQISNLEYLILRQDKLSDVPGLSYNPLKNIYDSYLLNGALNMDEERYLQNIINKTIREFPQYSPRNLQKLYATLFWLKYAANKQEHEELKEFIASIYEWYKRKRYLTANQIVAIKNTIEVQNKKIGKKGELIPEIELISE